MTERSDTPIVSVDLDTVDRNIARMQGIAETVGVAFRPHIKTHKLPLVAHRQVAGGAVGIACQKLGEAEVMSAAGLDDILISFPLVGAAKWERAARLAREIKLEVATDSALSIEGLAAAAAGRSEVGILVDCDVGRWRTGVESPAAALELARLAAGLPGVRFAGLFTHPWPSAAADWFAEAEEAFAGAGLEIPRLSLGGTVEAAAAAPLAGASTELRAGTYVYGDRACIAAGVSRREDCAMRIQATVVSTPSTQRAVLDAGSKTLTSDPADGLDDGLFGEIVDLPEARIAMLSEEHGHVDLSACPGALEVGQIVELLPNHACGVTNLHDSVELHRSGEPLGPIAVAARGRIR